MWSMGIAHQIHIWTRTFVISSAKCRPFCLVAYVFCYSLDSCTRARTNRCIRSMVFIHYGIIIIAHSWSNWDGNKPDLTLSHRHQLSSLSVSITVGSNNRLYDQWILFTLRPMVNSSEFGQTWNVSVYLPSELFVDLQIVMTCMRSQISSVAIILDDDGHLHIISSPGVSKPYSGMNLDCSKTHWRRDKMVDISQTIFQSALSWTKIYELPLNISLKFGFRGPINNVSASVRIMALIRRQVIIWTNVGRWCDA